MAVKEKQMDKPSRIWQYLKETHKWENYVFLFFSVVVLALGLLILTGALNVKEDAWLIGDYPKAFAWILVGLGVIALLLAVASFYRPSLAEVKHVTGLKRKEFFVNVITVFVFILVIAGLIFAYESVITLIENAFK